MASTYSSLQADIIALLHRSDLSSVVPSFISRAEARLNRVISPRLTETESTLAGVVGSRLVALPAAFNGPIALWISPSNQRYLLEPTLAELLPIVTSSGLPEFWALDGSNIAFDKPCDEAYVVYFRYYASFALSDSIPTNSLLTEAPDLYLYAALIESAPYVRDDGRLNTWQALYSTALQELRDAEHANKSLVPLRTDLPQRSGICRSNIYEG